MERLPYSDAGGCHGGYSAREKDEEMLEEMKRWLLKQKQVQCWNTPLATADAVYALLAEGMALTESGQMQAVAGNVTLETPKDGLGCISHTLSGAEAEVKTLGRT